MVIDSEENDRAAYLVSARASHLVLPQRHTWCSTRHFIDLDGTREHQ